MPAIYDYDTFDEVVVERIVNGRRVGAPIGAPEAAEAVRRLARVGFSDGQIAFRIGFTRRAVQRIRSRRGVPAALSPSGGGYGLIPLTQAPTRARAAG